MEGKEAIRKASKGTNASSSIKKRDHLLNPSYITTQEKVDSALKQFGISGIEAIPAGPSGRINNLPKGFFCLYSNSHMALGIPSFL